MRKNLRRSAAFRHASEQSAGVGGEENRSARAPGTASRFVSIAENLRSASRYIDPLQLLLGEEGDETAVGRPERIGGAVGRFESPRLEAVERANPEPVSAVGRGGDESELTAVGRKRRHALERRTG